MPLKLMMTKDDKILVGDDCIVTVKSIGNRVQLEVNAPPDVKIVHLHSNPLDQWKNRRKAWEEANE